MKRIDTATAQADKFGPGKNGFRDGDPTTALLATKLDADFFDNLQETTARVIEGAGIALDHTDMDQLTKALALVVQNRRMTYVADTGAANAYVLTIAPAIAAYVEGQAFAFKVTHTNTGAATLNVNGKGAVAVHRPDGAALQAGDLVAGEMAEVRYDGAAFQLSNPLTTVTQAAGHNSTKPASTAYVDSGLGAAIATAEGYTDTAKAAAIATAEGYADTKKAEAIATSEGYADTKKAEAIATAEAYANAAIHTNGASLPGGLKFQQFAFTTAAVPHGQLYPDGAFPTSTFPPVVCVAQAPGAGQYTVIADSWDVNGISVTTRLNGADATGIAVNCLVFGY